MRGIIHEARVAGLVLCGCLLTSGIGIVAAADETPREVAAAIADLEAQFPDSGTKPAAQAWAIRRHGAKKRLLAAGDLSVDPILARIRDILGLDRDGRNVIQGKNLLLHLYYSLLAGLKPQRAGELFLQVAALREDHPYKEERRWALWALGRMTYQKFLGDISKPTEGQLAKALQDAKTWWAEHGGKTHVLWKAQAMAQARLDAASKQPEKAMDGVVFLLQGGGKPDEVRGVVQSQIRGDKEWAGLANHHRTRAIVLAVRMRWTALEAEVLKAAVDTDLAVSTTAVAALGAIGSEKSLSVLQSVVQSADPDKAQDGLIAISALTGAWFTTADDVNSWVKANGNKSQEQWWLENLDGLIQRAQKKEPGALSILYTRVRRPIPPVSYDDLLNPAHGPRLEPWSDWYKKHGKSLKWDKQSGQLTQ